MPEDTCLRSQELERIPAKSGVPSLKARLPQGRHIYINSLYNPEREAEIWAQQVEVKPNDQVVLFGLGLGYHLAELQKLLPEEADVFVVEPSREIARIACESGPAAPLLHLPNIHLVSDFESFRKVATARQLKWRNVRLVRIPCYPEIFPKEYDEFAHSLSRELNSILCDRYTVLKSSFLWQRNCLKNLRRLPETAPVGSAFEQYSGRPAVLVSAGPSLAQNIHELRTAKSRALIIAVGTVARLLLSEGIVPDLILTFDGNIHNYEHHFKHLEAPRSILVFDPATHHRIVDEFQGPLAMMQVHTGNNWINEVLGRPVGSVKMGPSIANTGLDLAYRLGADPIILVGQDLAFTGRKSHVRGTHVTGFDGFQYEVPTEWFEGTLPMPSNGSDGSDSSLDTWTLHWRDHRLHWVESIDGGKVATDERLLSFLHWFERRIAELGGCPKVVDATEGGARIKGTEVLTLREALDQYAAEDVSDLIENVHRVLTDRPVYDLPGFTRYVTRTKAAVARLTKECRKGIRLSQSLPAKLRKAQPGAFRHVLRQLDKIDRKIEEAREWLKPLHYVTSPIAGSASWNSSSDESPEEICRLSELFYTDMYHAFAFSQPHLNELVKALERRSGKP